MAALSIRTTVPLMILVPLLTYVGLTGWMAVSNGRRTVDELSSLNSRTLNEQIKERLKDYLETPVLVSQLNANAIRLGELDVQNLDGLSRQFLAEMRLLDKIDGIEFGFAQTGAVRSAVRLEDRSLAIAIADSSTRFAKVYYATDKTGKRGRTILTTPNYDARQRPWYRKAVETNRLSWTKPFSKFSNPKLLQISLVQPIYTQNSRKLLGVLSVQFLPSNISQFLQTLKVGKSGKTFIINRAGELVATSTRETLFKDAGEEVQLIPAIRSQDPLIRETVRQLETSYPEFAKIPPEMLLKFPLEGELQLAQIARYNNEFGLDWRVITVVPQKDFTQGLEATTHQSILLGLSAFGVSVLVGLLATRWLVRPLLALSNAAQQIGNSEFDAASLTPLMRRSDEIGQLVGVFQEMFAVVHEREQALNTRVRELTDETDRLKRIETANRLSGASSLRELLQRSQHLRLQAEQVHLNLAELMRDLPFFKGLNPDELQALVALGQEQRLAAREVICRENEQENRFYIVLAGRVEVYLDQYNLSLSTLAAGSFFGEIALLLKSPRTASVRTLDPTILFVTDVAGFQTLCERYPELASQIDRKVRERQAALETSKSELQSMGLPGEDAALPQNFLIWSRKRLKTLLGM
ncbi:cache domain-containing protein [Altericista sp. CCNU0014]|uniref:cache domain-containing protein n=1 Tax=Altericista sp. CCNU0014 TaxID=3082949 RepID=UPI00384E05DF